MKLFGKKIEDLEKGDLDRLVESGRQESKILEYKRVLKIGSGDERKEFLADVSAFVNTEGE